MKFLTVFRLFAIESPNAHLRSISTIIVLIMFHIMSMEAYCQKPQKDANWLKLLPGCPCFDMDKNGVKLHDGWAKDKGNLNKYHRGATSSYRSYPAIRTSQGLSEQQCCYDSSGRLITDGRGAGTPDKCGSCTGEDVKGFMKVGLLGLFGHYWKDVRPWNKLMRKDSTGWKLYNATWIPDNHNSCAINNPNP